MTPLDHFGNFINIYNSFSIYISLEVDRMVMEKIKVMVIKGGIVQKKEIGQRHIEDSREGSLRSERLIY